VPHLGEDALQRDLDRLRLAVVLAVRGLAREQLGAQRARLAGEDAQQRQAALERVIRAEAVDGV